MLHNRRLTRRSKRKRPAVDTSNGQEDITHSPHVKCARLDVQEFTNLITQSADGHTLTMRDSDGHAIPGKVLRPRPARPQLADVYAGGSDSSPGRQELNGYRVLHMMKTEELWNMAISGHRNKDLSCGGKLHWDHTAEKSQGLSWSERLVCYDCRYVSPRYKLFVSIETNKRGRPAADLNVSLQVGLSQTMISNSAMQRILACVNIPPPSYSAMQHQANVVGDKIIELNRKDMQELRQSINDMNEIKGLARDAGIRVAGDAKYNKLGSNRQNSPFQPGTQVTYTLVEGETPHQYIINVFCGNKLCHTCSQNIGKGADGVKHGGQCSANLPLDASIGDEEQWAKQAVQEIQSDQEGPLNIAYATTDGDSRAVHGMADAQGRPVEHLLDTRHFGESLARAVDRLDFSANALPASTKKDKKRIQKDLSHNVKRRCTAEFEMAYKKLNGDIDLIINKLSYAIDALIQCYSGNCSRLCAKHSFICTGKPKGRWAHTYLPSQGGRLDLGEEDVRILCNCVSQHLGREGVIKTKFNTNSQKVEAIHRSFTSTNPQQVTMTRNFPARIHSAVHKVNRGLANSTLRKLEYVGAPLTKGTRPCRALKRMQRDADARLNKQKSQSYKQQRVRKRAVTFKLHAEKQAQPPSYKKDMLIPDINKCKPTAHARKQRRMHADHTYMKNAQKK